MVIDLQEYIYFIYIICFKLWKIHRGQRFLLMVILTDEKVRHSQQVAALKPIPRPLTLSTVVSAPVSAALVFPNQKLREL